jgi:peptidyl-prolyl cis-trans isomerase C
MQRRNARSARSPWILAACAGLAALALESRAVQADPSPVVARVGSRAITAAELERRLAAIAPFQLRTFGSTPEEIRRNYLEKVLVRDELLAQGAEDRRLTQREDVRDRVRAILKNAFVGKLRSEVLEKGRPTDAEVHEYYAKNAARYHTAARLNLWQIVVEKQEEAAAVVAEMKKDPTTKRWNELCRDKSLDKVTNMKGGNLGFVLPDGTTSEPGVKADPEVVRLASAAKDGEILEQPIKAGDRWVVVWRKTGAAAVERSVEMEAPSIRQAMLRERTDAKIKEARDRLREADRKDYAPELVDMLDVTAAGELTPVRRPGALPAGKKIGATPVPGPGLR